ncbi:WG repeat-containing protein [Ureibacillus composti]|nr:WG repeat-containing protein [Ureibacillus composti]
MDTSKLLPASIKKIGGTFWGFVNESGDFVIEPQYDYVFDFQDNGLARVEKNGLYGLIDLQGNYIVQPRYRWIEPFSEGRAAVQTVNEKLPSYKLIDETGKGITKKYYNYIGSFYDGRAVFQQNHLYGYLTRNGREVIPPIYTSAEHFSNGKAIVKLSDNYYYLLDENGKTLQKYPYPYIGKLSEGLIAFSEQEWFDDERKIGYLNEAGEVVIKPQYKYANEFMDERAVIGMSDNFRQNGDEGVIDPKGKIIIQPKYNDVKLLGEDRFAVGKATNEENPSYGSVYALATTKGNFLTDFVFDNLEVFKDGKASATVKGNTFFIDLDGKRLKNLPTVEGSGTLSLEDNIITANMDHRVYYYHENGSVIYQQNKIISINEQIQIIEEKYKPNVNFFVYYPRIVGIQNKQVQKKTNQELKRLSNLQKISPNEALSYVYEGDFVIESLIKDLLTMQFTGYEYHFGAAHGTGIQNFVTLNVKNGEFYELQELFKPQIDFITKISDIIKEQMLKEPEKYFSIDLYKGIKPNQNFTVTEDTLTIYFDSGEIAAYAVGFPKFTIPFSEIMELINEEGELWKALH